MHRPRGLRAVKRALNPGFGRVKSPLCPGARGTGVSIDWCIRATRLLVFILLLWLLVFALKRCYFQSWKVLIPHYSKWSEICSFKKVASLLRRYSGFHRTPPDRFVTWEGFFLLRTLQEKITWQKLQDKISLYLGVVMCDMRHPIHKIEQI